MVFIFKRFFPQVPQIAALVISGLLIALLQLTALSASTRGEYTLQITSGISSSAPFQNFTYREGDTWETLQKKAAQAFEMSGRMTGKLMYQNKAVVLSDMIPTGILGPKIVQYRAYFPITVESESHSPLTLEYYPGMDWKILELNINKILKAEGKLFWNGQKINPYHSMPKTEIYGPIQFVAFQYVKVESPSYKVPLDIPYIPGKTWAKILKKAQHQANKEGTLFWKGQEIKDLKQEVPTGLSEHVVFQGNGQTLVSKVPTEQPIKHQGPTLKLWTLDGLSKSIPVTIGEHWGAIIERANKAFERPGRIIRSAKDVDPWAQATELGTGENTAHFIFRQDFKDLKSYNESVSRDFVEGTFDGSKAFTFHKKDGTPVVIPVNKGDSWTALLEEAIKIYGGPLEIVVDQVAVNPQATIPDLSKKQIRFIPKDSSLAKIYVQHSETGEQRTIYPSSAETWDHILHLTNSLIWPVTGTLSFDQTILNSVWLAPSDLYGKVITFTPHVPVSSSTTLEVTNSERNVKETAPYIAGDTWQTVLTHLQTLWKTKGQLVFNSRILNPEDRIPSSLDKSEVFFVPTEGQAPSTGTPPYTLSIKAPQKGTMIKIDFSPGETYQQIREQIEKTNRPQGKSVRLTRQGYIVNFGAKVPTDFIPTDIVLLWIPSDRADPEPVRASGPAPKITYSMEVRKLGVTDPKEIHYHEGDTFRDILERARALFESEGGMLVGQHSGPIDLTKQVPPTIQPYILLVQSTARKK